MLKEKRIVKKILAVLMIVTMLLPYTSEVLAAALSHTDTTVNLETLTNHQGGEDDYLDFVSTDLLDNYDYSAYTYKIANSGDNGKTTVFKIRKEGDNAFEDALYCLNAEKSFPSATSKTYSNKGDLTDTSKSEVSAFKSNIGESNYKAILWLINNMYLRKQQPEEKEVFINKAFATQIADTTVIPRTTAEYIASILTDDDIEVVQQWAMWYFTNRSDITGGYASDYQTYCKAKYNALGTIYVSGATTNGTEKTFIEISESNGQARKEFANILFDYLVTNAKNANSSGTVTYPSFAMRDEDISCGIMGDYYKIGPFKVNSGTGTASIKVVDQNNAEIERSRYKILKYGEENFTNQNVNEIFDTDYYICIPMEGNTITKVNVTIDYTSYDTNASLWMAADSTMQPVVLITRGNTPHPSRRGIVIENKIFDLALRKYIVKVGNIEVTDRTPATPNEIASNGTAIYKHKKEPYTVLPGTNVVFELTVYNEGNLDGTATEITDYLPEGMTLATNSTINDTYGWVASTDGRSATTTYLANKTIEAYDGTNPLHKESVRIECTIASNIAENITNPLTLTNVAEITGYSRIDNDSEKSIVASEITNEFRGSTPADESLNDPNHYYPGLQDDDDFEKILINPIPVEQKLDLALRKYVLTAGNGAEGYAFLREPNVTTSSIATTGTATYKHEKAPVALKPGMNVVYGIRVYNEGNLDGTATEITDYLPEGMTLATNSTINDTYGWVASTDGRSATTTYLANKTIEAYEGGSTLHSELVKIECTISSDAADNIVDDRVLTNVAEITGYSSEDRDSWKSIDPTTITDSFSGNTSNPADLSKTDTYYKGLQDDDDFEKVVIEIKSFDLALKKFITKINGQELTTSREPVVDDSKLKDGTAKDATYTMPKTAVEVKKGDIVTYKIRVYNEGEIAGYAEEITDYLPAGLGYLMNYKDNISNKWSIPEGATTKKLSEIENGTSNLKAENFTEGTALNDQIVVLGGGKFKSTALASSDTSTTNLIPAYDGTKLSYKDVEITCIVLSDETSNNNLRNIAEVAKHTDEHRLPITDRDSIPDTVDPNNYPDGEKQANNGNPQDDHDYENLITPSTRYFDLALQKFITKLNNDEITNRAPTITKNTDGTFRYNHPTEALAVANNDEITYTIRVYNEGDIDGHAKEVMDDIPTGLVFLPENGTNKEYEWKMYDKDGKETTDVNQAVTVKTSYLSKEKETDSRQNIIKAYNAATMTTPDYKDVKIVFKVAETALTDKTKRDIINTAEITANQDGNGNNIDDKDSTPGNKKMGEDDIDQEKVNVKYFDLSLKKNIAKIVITENGKTREIVPKNDSDLLKVELNRKYLSTTTVKVVYNITITNEGQIAGYAKEVKDYIPKGMTFDQKENPNWTAVATDCVRTEALANTLLEPGKSATVQITLGWDKNENNLGEKVNIAEISKDYNDHGSPDIDSTPDNQKDGEDDIDNAPVILSISTGEEPVYVVLSSTVMLILAVGIALIKKYVLV